jgi:hypothetical protein
VGFHFNSAREVGGLEFRFSNVENEINPSGFFLCHLPVVRISPEWVTSPEQGKSSGRIVTFSFETGMLWDGVPPNPDKTDTPL